jgi:hypothetical protein
MPAAGPPARRNHQDAPRARGRPPQPWPRPPGRLLTTSGILLLVLAIVVPRATAVDEDPATSFDPLQPAEAADDQAEDDPLGDGDQIDGASDQADPDQVDQTDVEVEQEPQGADAGACAGDCSGGLRVRLWLQPWTRDQLDGPPPERGGAAPTPRRSTVAEQPATEQPVTDPPLAGLIEQALEAPGADRPTADDTLKLGGETAVAAIAGGGGGRRGGGRPPRGPLTPEQQEALDARVTEAEQLGRGLQAKPVPSDPEARTQEIAALRPEATRMRRLLTDLEPRSDAHRTVYNAYQRLKVRLQLLRQSGQPLEPPQTPQEQAELAARLEEAAHWGHGRTYIHDPVARAQAIAVLQDQAAELLRLRRRVAMDSDQATLVRNAQERVRRQKRFLESPGERGRPPLTASERAALDARIGAVDRAARLWASAGVGDIWQMVVWRREIAQLQQQMRGRGMTDNAHIASVASKRIGPRLSTLLQANPGVGQLIQAQNTSLGDQVATALRLTREPVIALYHPSDLRVVQVEVRRLLELLPPGGAEATALDRAAHRVEEMLAALGPEWEQADLAARVRALDQAERRAFELGPRSAWTLRVLHQEIHRLLLRVPDDSEARRILLNVNDRLRPAIHAQGGLPPLSLDDEIAAAAQVLQGGYQRVDLQLWLWEIPRLLPLVPEGSPEEQTLLETAQQLQAALAALGPEWERAEVEARVRAVDEMAHTRTVQGLAGLWILGQWEHEIQQLQSRVAAGGIEARFLTAAHETVRENLTPLLQEYPERQALSEAAQLPLGAQVAAVDEFTRQAPLAQYSRYDLELLQRYVAQLQQRVLQLAPGSASVATLADVAHRVQERRDTLARQPEERARVALEEQVRWADRVAYGWTITYLPQFPVLLEWFDHIKDLKGQVRGGSWDARDLDNAYYRVRSKVMGGPKGPGSLYAQFEARGFVDLPDVEDPAGPAGPAGPVGSASPMSALTEQERELIHGTGAGSRPPSEDERRLVHGGDTGIRPLTDRERQLIHGTSAGSRPLSEDERRLVHGGDTGIRPLTDRERQLIHPDTGTRPLTQPEWELVHPNNLRSTATDAAEPSVLQRVLTDDRTASVARWTTIGLIAAWMLGALSRGVNVLFPVLLDKDAIPELTPRPTPG